MRRISKLALALALAGCGSRSHPAVMSDDVELRAPTDQLVCHVRSIADAERLSFHYGTSDQPFGTMATFRLIGDGYEIFLHNPQRLQTFILQVIDVSPEGDRSDAAKRAFLRFRTALMKSNNVPCGR